MNKKDKHVRYSENMEIRALDPNEKSEYIIEGYAVVYEQEVSIGGWFNEIVKRGALDGADLTDVPLFIHHNGSTIPLARSRRNNPNSTLQLIPDERGLFFRATLDVDNNAEAKSLYSAIQRGDISGMSYAFRVDEEKWLDLEEPIPTREIYKFKQIGEISALWSPAYDGTSIEARGKGLDNPDKLTLDNVRAKALDNVENELEVERLKTKIKLGGNR